MSILKLKVGVCLALGLVAALTVIAYSNSFGAGFHFDDFHQIVKNYHLRGLDNMSKFFTDPGVGSYDIGAKGYRPLTYISFAANYALSGYNLPGFHMVNLVLHLLNGVLVYYIVASILGEQRGGGGFIPAAFVSAAFALHPIQTAAVTYISGRSALLASFFYLLAFASFLIFRKKDRYMGAGGYLWMALSAVLYFFALLSKEMAVSLPAVLVAYDLLFTAPGKGGARAAFRTGLYYLPFAAALGIFLAARHAVMGFAGTENSVYGVGTYLVTEAKVLLMYVRLLVLPMNQNADYNLLVSGRPDLRVAVSAVLAAFVLYMLYRLRKGRPALAFFGFWFFLALLPESSLVPITDVAVEYRLYLPSLGLIACVPVLAAGALKAPRLGRTLAVCLVLMLGILAFTRNRVWATEYTLWSDVARKSPFSTRAHGSLGTALLNEGRYAEAVRELKMTLEINPYGYKSYFYLNSLGLCYYQMGRLPEAAGEFRKALEMQPGAIEPYVNLSNCYSGMGRYQEAIGVIRMAVSINPDYPTSRYTLARLYALTGNQKAALEQILVAKRLSPREFTISLKLAEIYYGNGMSGQAVEQAKEALTLAMDETQRLKAQALLERLQGGESR